MRPEGLRAATAKAAGEARAADRRRAGLASADKTGRKRMAEVTTVYRIAAAPRTIDDVVPAGRDTPEAVAARAAKRRTAPARSTAGWRRRSSRTSPPRSPPCSTRPSSATPTTGWTGWPSSTGTTPRSAPSRPRPPAAAWT